MLLIHEMLVGLHEFKYEETKGQYEQLITKMKNSR